ncbi:hypothetical protein TraAM80_04530 [Trypanosoma rangeli]|uniref:Uncharacterized protein n=1 Tax=Trypanosoma rangeli TaxID=5698 RepID=A0A3R7KFK6_TRYRA|nr:uncharacterized protein TraAM80_04530 [Trypanosoma rangeli]RNF05490.1 hypothetical protein TraAM80_04530 [Trypanosoma rangeli]|eukprot:RNF05490.1 hypothetical protein TraAM80_04530 [Trypanosoma rangeli]
METPSTIKHSNGIVRRPSQTSVRLVKPSGRLPQLPIATRDLHGSNSHEKVIFQLPLCTVRQLLHSKTKKNMTATSSICNSCVQWNKSIYCFWKVTLGSSKIYSKYYAAWRQKHGSKCHRDENIISVQQRQKGHHY